MQLTEQQRAELERREWRPEVECGEFQTWGKITGECIATLYADGFFTFSGDPTLAAEFLAVAGYQPPGYRLVPEEVAEKALPAAAWRVIGKIERRIERHGPVPQEACGN